MSVTIQFLLTLALIALLAILFQNYLDSFLETNNFDWIPSLVSSQIHMHSSHWSCADVSEHGTRGIACSRSHLVQNTFILSWCTSSYTDIEVHIWLYGTLRSYSGLTLVFWDCVYLEKSLVITAYALNWVDFDPRKIRRSCFFLASFVSRELHCICIMLNGKCFLNHSESAIFYELLMCIYAVCFCY